MTIRRIEKASPGERLLQLAEAYGAEIAQAIARAARAGASAADLQAAARALAAGNLDAAMAALGLTAFLEALEAVRRPLQGAVMGAADLEAAKMARLPQIGRLGVVFDSVNPALTDWMRRYQLTLIREIGARTKEGIRTALEDGLQRGLNPMDTARQVRPVIGLTQRQALAVARFRKELATFHEKRSAKAWGLGKPKSKIYGLDVMPIDADGRPLDGITDRRLRDRRYDATLRRAMQSGKPLAPEQIDTMVEAYARRWLKHRSLTIARTESLRAVQVGAREPWRQAVEAGKIEERLIRRRWLTAGDERVRLSHRPIPRMNAGREGYGIGFAETFLTPDGRVLHPPHGPNCRCTVIHRLIEPEMVGQPIGPLAAYIA